MIQTVNGFKFPEELTVLPNWVCWSDKGNPISPLTGNGINWPNLLAPYEVAGSFAHSRNMKLGFVWQTGLRMFGIDWDSCRNPVTGEIEKWALEWIVRFDSYTEVSSSQTGLKTICKGFIGDLPSRKFIPKNAPKYGDHSPHAEIFQTSKYFALTGRVYNDRPVMDRQDVFEQFARECLGWVPEGERQSVVVTPPQPSGNLDFLKDQPAPSGLKPGDDFNQRHTPGEVLESFGWSPNGNGAWKRPGKTKSGHSATLHKTNPERVLFWSTEHSDVGQYGFDSADIGKDQPTYSAFEIYARMKHGGDFSAAAKELAAQGYGTQTAPTQLKPAQPTANPSEPVNEQPKPILQTLSLSELSTKFPTKRQELISGYLRRGETMNVIASPKVGKSWLVLLLAFKVATGKPWLGAQCRKGRVLIVDNELHPDELADRLRILGNSLGLDFAELPIDVCSMRGLGYSIQTIAALLADQPHSYDLIILDALYRFLPSGTNENDNAAMMQVYNTLDAIARNQDAAIAVIHHSSKGDQSGKSQTDIGAGAGSISRAADTHLTIRHHAEEGYQVLEAVTRSFVQPEAKSIYFQYPVWNQSDVEATVRTNQKANRQEQTDQETKEAILNALKASKRQRLTYTKIRTETGFGLQRVQRGVMLLEAEKTVSKLKVKSRKTNRQTAAAKLESV